MLFRSERRNRRLVFQQNAQLRIKEIKYYPQKTPEMLRQNLDEVENLMLQRTSLANLEIEQTFTLNTPKFSLGQWIDVKDTVGQWLEAQVAKIHGDMIYVHFNGWGSRWDEWIQKDSPRMSQFRTYTIQSPLCPFLSPYPYIEPDASEHEIPSREVSYNDSIIRYIQSYDKVRGMIIKYLQTKMELSKQRNLVQYCNQLEIPEETKIPSKCRLEEFKNEREKQILTERKMKLLCGQLSPILDRMGRMMSDMSSHFVYTSQPNNPDTLPTEESVLLTRFPNENENETTLYCLNICITAL